MNKTAGIVVVVGLVLVAAWLLLSGKLSASAATSGATGAAGTTVNPLQAGAPLTNELSSLAASLATLGSSLLGPNEQGNTTIATAVGAGLVGQSIPGTAVSAQTGIDLLPATPAPVTNIPGTDLTPVDLSSAFTVPASPDSLSALGGSVDLSGITDASGDLIS